MQLPLLCLLLDFSPYQPGVSKPIGLLQLEWKGYFRVKTFKVKGIVRVWQVVVMVRVRGSLLGMNVSQC